LWLLGGCAQERARGHAGANEPPTAHPCFARCLETFLGGAPGQERSQWVKQYALPALKARELAAQLGADAPDAAGFAALARDRYLALRVDEWLAAQLAIDERTALAHYRAHLDDYRAPDVVSFIPVQQAAAAPSSAARALLDAALAQYRSAGEVRKQQSGGDGASARVNLERNVPLHPAQPHRELLRSTPLFATRVASDGAHSVLLAVVERQTSQPAPFEQVRARVVQDARRARERQRMAPIVALQQARFAIELAPTFRLRAEGRLAPERWPSASWATVGAQVVDTRFMGLLQLLNPEFFFSTDAHVLLANLERFVALPAAKAAWARQTGLAVRYEQAGDLALVSALARERYLASLWPTPAGGIQQDAPQEIERCLAQHLARQRAASTQLSLNLVRLPANATPAMLDEARAALLEARADPPSVDEKRSQGAWSLYRREGFRRGEDPGLFDHALATAPGAVSQPYRARPDAPVLLSMVTQVRARDEHTTPGAARAQCERQRTEDALGQREQQLLRAAQAMIAALPPH
jgi:hypothetical protein